MADTDTTATPEVEIYDIPEHRFADLEKKVARFGRRSAKLGSSAAITIETLGEKFVERRVWSDERGAWVNSGEFDCFIQIRVHGEAPVVNGYTFVARIEHTEAGNVISKAPGAEAIEVPNEVRDAAAHCDHCSTQRHRNDTFLLREDESGTLKRVGRNCLADFVRSTDATRALAIWTLLRDIEDAARPDPDGGWGGDSRYFRTADYVAYCFRSVEIDGWQSRSGATEYGPRPTADAALFGINPCPGMAGYETQAAWRNAQPTDENRKEAAEAMEWAKGLEGKSDYEHNLKVACSLECVKPKNMGIVASLTIAYRRHCEREIERAQRAKRAKTSTHFGKIGSRYLRTLTVTKTVDMDNEQWGLTVLYVLEDEDGAQFKWFASGGGCYVHDDKGTPRKVDAGDSFPFVFTVKRHSEFKEMKETVINRATPQTTESAAAVKWVGKDGEIFKSKKAMKAAEEAA